jgi:hypothetical protein
MSSLVIAGDTSGSVTLSAPTVAGAQTFTLPYGAASTTSSAADITLTNTSNRVQNVAMTAASKSVILPNATTMATGASVLMINNTGYNSFYIKLSTGVITHILSPGTQIQLSLTDNSTSQGQWSSQIGPIAFGNYLPTLVDTNSVQLSASAGATYPDRQSSRAANQVDNSYFLVQPLTSTTMFIAWIRSNKSVYGCVATNTSGVLSFGTITLLYDGSVTNALVFSGRMLSSTAGIITVDRTSNAVAIPITISGTTITVGTTSATFGTAVSNVNGAAAMVVQALMPLSATLLGMVYSSSAGTALVNTITHNGASAPTIGTASTGIAILNNSSGAGVTLTSTTAQIIYSKSGTPSTTGTGTRVVTFSGTSAPTLGTELTTYTNGCYGGMRGIAYSSTETAFLIGDGASAITTLSLSFTISGTTVTLQKAGILMGDANGDGGAGAYYFNNLASVNSTTYISTTGYAASGSYIAKLTYVPGDSLFPSIINQSHLMSTKPFGGFSTIYGAGGALTYNYNGSYATANTIIPSAGWGGTAIFSGSSTTGLFLGVGQDYSSAANSVQTGATYYIMAQVFTIL